MSDPSSVSCAWDPRQCTGTPQCPPRCPRFVDATGTPLVVRPYTATDRDALESMYEDFDPVHRAQGLPPLSRDRRTRWLSRMVEEGRNFVAEREGEIVGHALFTPTDQAIPELAVFVHQSVHGLGIGTECCKHAIAAAADAGHDTLELHVERHNRAARSVYQSLGFELKGHHGPELRMRLSLSGTVATRVQQAPAVRLAADSEASV